MSAFLTWSSSLHDVYGFHNKDSKYTWRRNVANASIVLDDEIFPLMYTSMVGRYTCKVEIDGHEAVGTFDVKGMLKHMSLCIAIIPETVNGILAEVCADGRDSSDTDKHSGKHSILQRLGRFCRT